MRKYSGLGLAALIAFSCGGSKGANAPTATTHAPSHVSMIPSMQGDEGTEVTGPAFAQYVPSMKLLTLVVFDASTDPAPDCSMLGSAGMQKLKSGKIATIGISEYSGARTGKFPVGQSGAVSGNVAKQEMHMGSMLPDKSQIEITTYDANSLIAVAEDPSGKSVANIDATVCPDAKADAYPTQTAQSTSIPMGVDPSASNLKISMNGKMQDTNGEAMVKLDPKGKALSIYVYDQGYQPAPTCEQFGSAATDGQAGEFAAVGIAMPKRKTGSFPVAGGLFADVDTQMQARGSFDATTIEIKQFDDGGFVAKITSAPTAKSQVSGTISASVCADGPITFSGDTSVDESKAPKKKSKKKK